MNKLPIILEYIWLALSLFCVSLGIHATVNRGINVGRGFFFLAALALLMFFFRRFRRLKAKK